MNLKQTIISIFLAIPTFVFVVMLFFYMVFDGIKDKLKQTNTDAGMMCV